jgi:dienelactone hydrolase
MPDFLLGSYATPDMFSGSPEGTAKRDAYLSGFPGKPQTQSEAFGQVLQQLKAEGARKVGVVGFCWGWKAIVTSSAVNQFDCVAACHPS